MSLTSFLENSPDVRRVFLEQFRKPGDSRRTPLLAPPRSRNFQLVGVAFDYLVRWHLSARHTFARTSGPWIAELGLEYLSDDPPRFRRGSKVLQDARRLSSRFPRKGSPSTETLRAALQVARLDFLYRAPPTDAPISFKVSRQDIEDLRVLYEVLPPKKMSAKRVCILNPTFVASSVVGGADVDLVLDDLMLDIKTTKDSKCWRAYFNQLVGYYLLYRLGGFAISGRQPRIARLGIYFARQASLVTWAVSDIASAKTFEFMTWWFEAHARARFAAV